MSPHKQVPEIPHRDLGHFAVLGRHTPGGRPRGKVVAAGQVVEPVVERRRYADPVVGSANPGSDSASISGNGADTSNCDRTPMAPSHTR